MKKIIKWICEDCGLVWVVYPENPQRTLREMIEGDSHFADLAENHSISIQEHEYYFTIILGNKYKTTVLKRISVDEEGNTVDTWKM